MTLNERAARLMFPPDTPYGRVFNADTPTIRVRGRCYRFTDDLNDAAEFWAKAPEEVKTAVIESLSELGDEGSEGARAAIKLFTNPARLTETVVVEWEAFNAKC